MPRKGESRFANDPSLSKPWNEMTYLEKARFWDRDRYKRDKEKRLELSRAIYKRDSEKIKARTASYQRENRLVLNEKRKTWQKEYLASNPFYRTKRKEAAKVWHAKNKKAESEYRKKYRSERFKKDPIFKLEYTCRARIHSALKSAFTKKSTRTSKLIGCTPIELKEYLESRFLDGMNWDNHGVKGWHIDHIKPCAAFDLSNPYDQLKCFHYTNLQPLWWKDNIIKSDNYTQEINT